MDITEFFQLTAGKWFSQRTNLHLALQKTEEGKSNLQIEMLAKNDPAVVQLCQQHEVDPALALCGSRVIWDGTIKQDQTKRTGSTVLAAIANSENPNEGKLLVEAPVAGRYLMGTDDVLTLITESETMYLEERLWFASPNLRLRTGILKQSGSLRMTSFCSEIRMGGAPATTNAAATAQSR